MEWLGGFLIPFSYVVRRKNSAGEWLVLMCVLLADLAWTCICIYAVIRVARYALAASGFLP